MIGHMTAEFSKPGQDIMLDFSKTGGGCSPANPGTIDSDTSGCHPSKPIPKYTKREKRTLTNMEEVKNKFKAEIFGRGKFVKMSERFEVEKR